MKLRATGENSKEVRLVTGVSSGDQIEKIAGLADLDKLPCQRFTRLPIDTHPCS